MSAAVAVDLRTAVLEPTMDARAENLGQAAKLARLDTPETDSVIERVRALRAHEVGTGTGLFLIRAAQVDALEDDVWFLVESNGREGQSERAVAGASERIAADLYSTADRRSYDYRAIARDLRPVLRTIGAQLDPDRPDPPENERAVAWVAWGALAREIPAETLAGRSLANELGAGPTRTLRSLTAQLAEGRRS